MEMHWFVWLVIGAMSTFGFVVGAVALITRVK